MSGRWNAGLALVLAVPMGLGLLLSRAGQAPSLESIGADASHAEEERRKEAVEWIAATRIARRADLLLPFLEDPEARVRSKAIRAIGKMRNPTVLPMLEEAFSAENVEGNQRDILEAMKFVRYPQAASWLERHEADEREEMAETARELREQLLRELNKEASFYSPGDRIMNRFGYVIASQAALFPPGQEQLAAEGNHDPR